LIRTIVDSGVEIGRSIVSAVTYGLIIHDHFDENEDYTQTAAHLAHS
jgi:hypothetical protein